MFSFADVILFGGAGVGGEKEAYNMLGLVFVVCRFPPLFAATHTVPTAQEYDWQDCIWC